MEKAENQLDTKSDNSISSGQNKRKKFAHQHITEKSQVVKKDRGCQKAAKDQKHQGKTVM